MSVQEAYPHALIQFEDFLTPRAFALLRRYRDRVLCFNDDIQGTAAVVLAGAYGAAHIAERPLEKSRVMFLGAGSVATGIADLMVQALVERGLTPDDARRRLWFVDVSGLVVQSRRDLQPHNLPYAHPHQPMEFVDALRAIRPHMLIGATGHPGTFTQEVVRVMAELNDRPSFLRCPIRPHAPNARRRKRTNGAAAAWCSPAGARFRRLISAVVGCGGPARGTTRTSFRVSGSENVRFSRGSERDVRSVETGAAHPGQERARRQEQHG